MSDGANDFSFEGLEYAFSGGWPIPVWGLIHWLRANACAPQAYELERHAQLISPVLPPEVEQATLTAIREELAVLYNTPPAQLTPQQYKELSGLRRNAARYVQYRLRQLADRHESEERAASNLGAGVAALLASIPANSIQRDGAAWVIRYGAEHGQFPAGDFRVIDTLALVLARPGHQHSLETLVDDDTARLLAASGGKDDVHDAETIRRLRPRVEQLQRDKAKTTDPVVIQEIEAELAGILAEIKQARGPGGRRRRLGRTDADRAWDALTTNLRRLWPRLREAGMPDLAAHLDSSTVVSRPHITYLPPDGTPPWAIER